MTKEDLLRELNQEARKLRLPPVTARRLNDWIDEGLLEKAKALGAKRGVSPTWQIPVGNLVRGQLILKSISLGAIRKNQKLLFLWVHDCEFEHEILRDALSKEFWRFVKRQQLGAGSKYDHRIPVDGTKIEQFTQRLPKLDSRLAKFDLHLDPNAVLLTISKMFFGATDNPKLKDAFENVAEAFDPSVQSNLATFLEKMNLEGHLGLPSEIDKSGISILRHATESDFFEGRANFKIFLGVFQFWNECLDETE